MAYTLEGSILEEHVEVRVSLVRGRVIPPRLRDSLIRIHWDGRAVQKCDCRHRRLARSDLKTAAAHKDNVLKDATKRVSLRQGIHSRYPGMSITC